LGLKRHEAKRLSEDVRVHREIYRASSNPHLDDIVVSLDAHATRIWCLFLDRLPDVASHVREHVALLRAITDGDADTASALTLAHVAGFEKAIRNLLWPFLAGDGCSSPTARCGAGGFLHGGLLFGRFSVVIFALDLAADFNSDAGLPTDRRNQKISGHPDLSVQPDLHTRRCAQLVEYALEASGSNTSMPAW
jgi:hypothetical protein